MKLLLCSNFKHSNEQKGAGRSKCECEATKAEGEETIHPGVSDDTLRWIGGIVEDGDPVAGAINAELAPRLVSGRRAPRGNLQTIAPKLSPRDREAVFDLWRSGGSQR